MQEEVRDTPTKYGMALQAEQRKETADTKSIINHPPSGNSHLAMPSRIWLECLRLPLASFLERILNTTSCYGTDRR
jgi:hypothetical protein